MQSTIESLDPQKYVLIKGINFFFDKYGKKGILPNVKEICLEYLEAEVPQEEENDSHYKNHRKLIIDYMSSIIMRNVKLIMDERKSLLNIYEQEWEKSHAFPTKKMAQVASILTSNQRKILVNICKDPMKSNGYHILKTIDLFEDKFYQGKTIEGRYRSVKEIKEIK